MSTTDAAIRAKFRVKHRDNLPYTGWAGTRVRLAELFAELGFTKGAEVGVCYGVYSAQMCTANPNLELMCVDPWHAFLRHSQDHMDGVYNQAKTRLAPHKATLIRKTSMEAVKDVPDGSLDFVYIDGLHDFDAVMLDIIHWTPKVRIGGIVSGHDFCQEYQGGVVTAVEAYTRAHNISSWYLTQLDRQPSWVWAR